jgi:methionyl-tRNA formyltransferase
MRIVFMGTPDFAVPCLARLLADGRDVVLAVSQPDKPKGRKQILTPPPVKEFARARHIEVFQPQSLKTDETAEKLAAARADVFAVVAYGKILPERVLALPPLGCINVHASLLPKLRGAAPVQWAIARGETQTGVTTMYMEKGLDTGDMLLKKTVEISKEETGASLHDKLSLLGAEALSETLSLLENGGLKPEKQAAALSSYAPMLSAENARIDFEQGAVKICNHVRAFFSAPCARCLYRGRVLKILKAEAVETDAKGENGEILFADSERGIGVKAKNGAVRIKELQIEGKRAMTAAEFLRGNTLTIGEILE